MGYHDASRAVGETTAPDRLDLSDAAGALAWARRHVPDAFPEMPGPPESAGYRAALDQMAAERAEEYADLHRLATGGGPVRLWRAVRLESIADLDTAKVGNHWSFAPAGAGQQQGPEGFGRIHVLTAETDPGNIDWEYGFASYMHYGAEQSEAALLPDSEVLVTHADGEPLDPPISAATGPGRDYNYAT
jgi:hypothetical protein